MFSGASPTGGMVVQTFVWAAMINCFPIDVLRMYRQVQMNLGHPPHYREML